MTMGTCQSCGATAPIEWFLSEVQHRQLCAVLVELPKPVQDVVFSYLAMFKPQSGRSMATAKAARLLGELRDLVAKGYVSVKDRVDRDCPPRIWRMAIEQMMERRERLTLPLPNHNYLKTIAWDLADKEDARAEKSQKRVVIRVSEEIPVSISSPLDEYIQGLRDDKPTDEEMAAWRKQRMGG